MSIRSLRAVALLATNLLAAGAASQVPPGSALAFTRFFTGPGIRPPTNPATLQLFDPSGGGTALSIPGLPASSSNPASGAIDPVTGDVVLGGYHNDARLSIHAFGAGGVTSSRTLATVLCQASQFGCSGGLALALNGLDFDRNGDYFVCNNVEIWRVDRATGATTLWDTIVQRIPGAVFGEIFNGLAIDRARDRMWVASYNGVVSGPGLGIATVWEYDLTTGPQAGRVVLDIAGRLPQLSPYMTGIAHDGKGHLFIAALTYNGAPSLMMFDVASGHAAGVPGAPLWHAQDVAVDQRLGAVHLIGAGGCATLDPSSGIWAQTLAPPAPSAPQPVQIAVNDLLDRTEVFPRAPSVGARFVLEAAAHALPGDIAGLFVVAVGGVPLPAAIQLGIGIADAGGFVRARVPLNPVGLPAGLSLTVAGARIDGATGRLVIASPADVVFQP